jgi:DNA-binding CsgD family transcriptional regulator
MALLAYEEAAEHFERALQALDVVAPDAAARRGELLLALGQARMAASEIPAARAAYEQVASLARGSGAPELLARAALGLGLEFTAGIVDELEVRLLEEARRGLPATDEPLRARVLARLAKALLFTPDHDRRLALSEEAVAIARRVGDPATLAAVLYDRHVAIWGFANAGERLAIATEVIELAERHGDRSLALQGRALRMGNLLELGEVAALRGEIDRYDRTTRELHQLQYLWHVPLLRATLAALVGRFDEAERLAVEGRALGERAQHQGIAVFFPTVMLMIRYLQGRFAELADAPAFVERFPSIPAFRSAYAHALWETGRADEARREFEQLALDDFAGLPRDFTRATTLSSLAFTCAALGDAPRAAVLYALLLPFAPYNVRTTRIGIVCFGSAAHYLGLLAATRQCLDDAARQFEAALAMNARLGSPPFLAISQYELARVLVERGGPGDRDRARALLDQALATAGSLGNRRLAGLARALRERVADTAPASLSRREVEVLRLIAAGKSNQQIADELVISLNTVLHHVTNILGKTATANRAEAAVYAARRGLLS